MKKTIEVNVKGIEIAESKPRTGTRCQICGEEIGNFSFYRFSLRSASVAYAHRACCEMRNYHETFYTPNGNTLPLFRDNGKATKEEILCTFELEANTDMFQTWTGERIAQFLSQNHLTATADGTVDVEFHMNSRVNFHGMKDFLESVSSEVDMQSANCGLHMNFSWYDCTQEDMQILRDYAQEIFGAAQSWLYVNSLECEKVFGRWYSDYCACDYRYRHGSWLNIIIGSTDENSRIEYRLPHFDSVKQAVDCAFMLKEWTKAARAFCRGEIRADRASKRILKALEHTASGTATWQRAERNAKAR